MSRKMEIRVVEDNNSFLFQQDIDIYLKNGFVVSSTSCGEIYKAILVKENEVE